MSHQDQEGRKCRFNAEYLKRALQWLLRSVTWSSVACRSDCSWAVPQGKRILRLRSKDV